MRLKVCVIAGILLSSLAGEVGYAQSRATADKAVKELGLEELLNVEVTSVARKAQRLSDSAAAVFVLTRSDIRRSGATTLPGVLRLVPGVEVARIDSNKWAVSVRGFNNRFANKLLVLIDGRSAYSQLYDGVFWETTDLPLEDIERIEVIRGPGGTMWGANAVNGVINIITTHSRESEGTLVSVTGETVGPGGLGTVRQGWHLGDTGGLRVYAKGLDRTLTNGPAMHDRWSLARGGFRADGGTAERGFSLQGSAYSGQFGQTYAQLPTLTDSPQTPGDSDVHGGQFSGALTRGRSASSLLTLRSFVDYTYRKELLLTDRRFTADVDLQHRLAVSRRHDVVYGAGYRRTNDDVLGTAFASFSPRKRGGDLFSVFAQDEIAVTPAFHVTAGTKFEHSTIAGGGWQPSTRAIWNMKPSHAVWGAVSRALRTPSRAELDVTVVLQQLPPSPLVPLPTQVVRESAPDMKPEVLWAYEGGYRGRLGDRLSVDLTAYLGDYSRLSQSVPGGAVGARRRHRAVRLSAAGAGRQQHRDLAWFRGIGGMAPADPRADVDGLYVPVRQREG